MNVLCMMLGSNSEEIAEWLGLRSIEIRSGLLYDGRMSFSAALRILIAY